jgi:hypothetical protein
VSAGVDECSRILTDSQREWLAVQGFLVAHRYELAVAAAGDYPAALRVAGTPLLADPRWLPDQPLDLEAVELTMSPEDEKNAPDGYPFDVISEVVLPLRPDGTRYPNYSAVVADLSPPATFENRATYRLLEANLSTPGPMAFGRGTYFDGLDVGEACAHEYAASVMTGGPRPLREVIGAPWDLLRRPVNMAISTLTLRVDQAAGEATFLLHRRDAAKVGHAGGLYQVLPVGIFQPSGNALWNERNDFDLWRSIVREYAEELLDLSEDYDSERAPVDYDAWPFARQLGEGRRAGAVRVSVLGLGVDPLTFATDLLVVAAFQAAAFDEFFGGLVSYNSEGQVLSGAEGGLTFTRANVGRFVRREPMQAAGAALLELAWRHRRAVLLS